MSMRRPTVRRSLTLIGALALIVPLLLAFAMSASAATRCVNTGGTGGCYGSIQDAVNVANGGDVIHVYPGTYDESVNLSAMDPDGDLSLVTVNNAGAPTPGTVTVEYSGLEPEFFTTPPLDGDLTIAGFIVHSAYPGIAVKVDGGSGADRDLFIFNVTATGTQDDGMWLSADGDVTVRNCSASDNDKSGIHVSGVGGDVLIRNCTARGNRYGVLAAGLRGSLMIESCLLSGNESGVELDELTEADQVQVNGNIICGNSSYGLSTDATANTDAEGNWWGCADGPNDPGGICDAVNQGPPALVFTPWISRITSGGPSDPVVVGEATVVTFQFHGGPPPVYLGQGPGDLRGPAPFTVSTDNGTLNGEGASVQEFINAAEGTLKVTLVPARAGAATVTVSGPCGLAALEGATAVLGVESEFVPEPGTMLPLGSGLMGLAGYAGLRLRKK